MSGKILDVFYDEFVKFVPPHILKIEQEKRKKIEDEKPSKPKVSQLELSSANNPFAGEG